MYTANLENRKWNGKCVRTRFLLSVILFFLCVAPLFADTFLLEGGGKIEGKLLNPGERIRQIETVDGTVLSLDVKLIKETFRDESEDIAHYKKTVPFLPDTVETHLANAAWCREKKLKEQEKEHLYRILDLDPEHLDTRKRLKYSKDKTGQWTTEEEQKTAKGYVLEKGNWRMPQELWINERTNQRKETLNDWKQDIKQIRASLNNPVVRKKLEEITDPTAVKPLADMLKKETNPDIRIILVRALSSIGTSDAVREVAFYAMNDSIEAVREICMDQIKRNPDMIPQAGAYFGTYLINMNTEGIFANSPDVINQAAMAIGVIGDTNSIGSLITALVSKHKETVTVGPGDRTNVGFGGGMGGTGFTQGQSKQEIINNSKNAAVLATLRKLTGVDFGYDQAAWTRWLKEKRQVGTFDARRG